MLDPDSETVQASLYIVAGKMLQIEVIFQAQWLCVYSLRGCEVKMGKMCREGSHEFLWSTEAMLEGILMYGA